MEIQSEIQHTLKTEFYGILRDNEDLLLFSEEYATGGILYFDPEQKTHFWHNIRLQITCSISEMELKTRDQIIFEEDRSALFEAQPETELPIRLVHANGSVILATAYVKRIVSGGKERMIAGFSNCRTNDVFRSELEKQYKRLYHILEGTDIGSWEWNIQTGETIFNERWANIMGYTLEELEPTSIRTWLDNAHPDDLLISNQMVQDYLEGKSSDYKCEVRIRHKNGSWIWVLDKGKIVSYTPDGKPEWMCGSHEDITERKSAFERNKLFIEQAPTAIAMFDMNVCYLAASQRWLSDYGIPDTDIIGKSHYTVFPEIGDEWKRIHQECLAGAVLANPAEAFERQDGTVQWLSWEVRPWYNDLDEIGGILMYSQDMTELKAREKEQERLTTLLNDVEKIAHVGGWELDLATNNTFWTEEVYAIHEVDTDFEVNLFNAINFYHPDDRHLIQNALNLCRDKHKPFDLICRIYTNKGNLRWVRALGNLQTENGIPVKIIGVFQDITQQKNSEEKLRTSEAVFRGNFEYAAIGMGILNRSGHWVRLNQSSCRILGYPEDELIQKSIQEITHPDDWKKELPLVNELMRGKRSHYHIEKRWFHKDGHIVYTLASVAAIQENGEIPLSFVAHAVDITERVIAQERLQQTLAKLEGILDASSRVSIIGCTTEGIIQTFNKGAENLLGYTQSEVIDKVTPEVIHVPEEVSKRGAELTKLLGTPISGFDVFVEMAKRGKYETREWTYIRKDGSRFPVQLTVTAVRENGIITGFLGIAADISDIKKVEKEIISLLEITKDQNERLKNFAHIVSHNLCSHSSNFQMLLDILMQENPEFKTNQWVNFLSDASVNLQETIGHLNEVVLLNSLVKEQQCPINLHNAITSVTHNISILARENAVSIINTVDPDTVISGVPAYIDSILLNFLTNAIKYRSKSKESWVKLSSNKQDDYIVLKIEDNGIGIDLKRHGSKLFGMYKTFHGNNDARGIGLFITKNQIEAMDGKVDVESEPGKGTLFKIYLRHEEH